MTTVANYTWIPSTARVIVIDGFGTVPRGTLPVVQAALAWPVKDPADVLDYVFDLSEALAGNEGDGIAALDVAVSPNQPGDLVVQSSSANGDQAILWLAQGVPGTIYAVTITVVTHSGRALSRTVDLPVMALSRPISPPGALTDQNLVPLTDQAGNALTTS